VRVPIQPIHERAHVRAHTHTCIVQRMLLEGLGGGYTHTSKSCLVHLAMLFVTGFCAQMLEQHRMLLTSHQEGFNDDGDKGVGPSNRTKHRDPPLLSVDAQVSFIQALPHFHVCIPGVVQQCQCWIRDVARCIAARY
jgi:hypothetical protein